VSLRRVLSDYATFVIASQRVRPEVAGPLASSAKQSAAERAKDLDCFVALLGLLAMTAAERGLSGPSVTTPTTTRDSPAATGRR
jgi:hypothetical protein